MGEHDISTLHDEAEIRVFMQAMLEDLHALEHMLKEGMIADGEAHIGAEQEMFIVDTQGNPAPRAVEILDHIGDPRFTTEIAQYNLEANLTPILFNGTCLSQLEAELHEVVNLAQDKARSLDTAILLCGILPTLQKEHLQLDYMTPSPRYHEMNNAICRMRGGDLHVFIKGLDELHLDHNNVMLEACNTSFQLHLQVAPAQFAAMYNIAQAIAAPVMAVAVNSPLLMGKRLWHETRIALFQQSVDSRSSVGQERGQRTRVHFGDEWLQESITEIFKEDISRYHVLLTKALEEDPWKVIHSGGYPKLKALSLHSGTIWRWNRGCYGLNPDGTPHLRIESRCLPSGPSIVDEIANAALHYGLMTGLYATVADIRSRMAFNDAKNNFFTVARYGLNTQLTWLDGKIWSARDLLLQELLPVAREGLTQAGVDSTDRDHYLGIIEERLKKGVTGSQWVFSSLDNLDGELPMMLRLQTLVHATENRQKTGQPVHLWPFAEMSEMRNWQQSYQTVGQIMKTDLFTVQPNDLVDLAANMMDWKHIRHIPVEDEHGNLQGILSHRDIFQVCSQPDKSSIAVKAIMQSVPITVTPETSLAEALELLQQNHIGCLPVVQGTRLVGIITAHDFLELTGLLLRHSPERRVSNA